MASEGFLQAILKGSQESGRPRQFFVSLKKITFFLKKIKQPLA
jgi:hypothetical protein